MPQPKNDPSITIGFSTTKLISSRFFRWVTRSACSHSFITYHDRDLKMRMVMQAEAWGYEVRPWKRWRRENVLVAEFNPMGRPLNNALCEIAESLGEKFDFWNTFLLGIKCYIQKWLKAKCTLNPNRSPGKLNCTEAVINFLNYAKFRTARSLDPNLTSPGELLSAVIAHPEEFKAMYLMHRYIANDGKILLPAGLKKRRFTFYKDRDVHSKKYLKKTKGAGEKHRSA